MTKLINIVFTVYFCSEILIVKCFLKCCENVILNNFKTLAYNVYKKCYVNVKKTTQINVEAMFLRNVFKMFSKNVFTTLQYNVNKNVIATLKKPHKITL